jgi:hypothetical protein
MGEEALDDHLPRMRPGGSAQRSAHLERVQAMLHSGLVEELCYGDLT